MRGSLIKLYFVAFVSLLLPTLTLAGSATVFWNPNSDDDLKGYKVYYSTTKGGPYGSSTALISKTQTSYTISDLSPGAYYFVVVAVDTSNNESINSAEVSKTITSAVSSPASTPAPTVSTTSTSSYTMLPANGTYGQISGKAGQSNEVNFSFPARTKKATILYQAYNIGSSSKVSIMVNGKTVGYAGKTKTNKWGGNRSVIIPRTYLNSSSANTITFKNNISTSTTGSWGIRNVKVK
jgi:hypothetical protein